MTHYGRVGIVGLFAGRDERLDVWEPIPLSGGRVFPPSFGVSHIHGDVLAVAVLELNKILQTNTRRQMF